jgi:O-antigen/teichoic acid export membrane protein
LIGLEMGVLGILLGNLITAGLGTTLVTIINMRALGPPKLQLDLIPPLCRFGLPLVVTDFVTFLLLRSDQYFIRTHSTLDDLGLYSLADMMAMGLYALLITPFIRTWQALTFEIAEQPEANHEYAKFFEGFVYCFAAAFLAAALLADVVVRLLVSDAFYPAAQLMPVLLLSYFFFSLRVHVTVPSVLAKKTYITLVPTACAVVVCLLGNAIVVPMYGPSGAAWVKVIGMFWLAAHLLIVNRRLRKIDYSLALTTGIVFLCVGLVLATEWLSDAFDLSMFEKAALSITSLLVFTSAVMVAFALRYPAVIHKLRELVHSTVARF